MSRMQISIIVITVLLNALDGFDVLSISFASPLITAEFGIDNRVVGFVLSMELIGMGIGSIFLGGAADRFGRRPLMLGALALMSLGMFMVTTPDGAIARLVQGAFNSVGLFETWPVGIFHISFWRIITGIGIGGMLAAINAVVAENSNEKRKHMNVCLMAIGYPLGAWLGGFVASWLLIENTWHAVFYLGFGMTVSLIPIVYFFVPETVHWLARKQPAGALEKINASITRMGHAPVTVLPVITDEIRKQSVMDIFSPKLIRTTAVVASAYFLHIMTFYFIIKWVPNILVGWGFEPARAGFVLSWANFGGALGGLTMAFLTLKYNLKLLTIAAMCVSTVMVVVFGRSPETVMALTIICASAGFFTNATINGMYALFAHCYPTHVRAVGTGFAIGFGRGGAILAPILAGYLFAGGIGVPNTAVIMASGSLLAALALSFLVFRPEPPEAASVVKGVA